MTRRRRGYASAPVRIAALVFVVVARERGPVRDPRTHRTLAAEAALAEVPAPDVLVIPERRAA